MSKSEHISAAQMERRKEKLAKRERRDRTWNIVLLVLAIAFLVTVISIQIIHHV